MLVLRRTCGQSFVIGKNAEIKIKILRDENGTISIGIDAPKRVPVDRLEIYEKRQQTSHKSASSSLDDQVDLCQNDLREIFNLYLTC